ncbi:MAG: PAS domain-containing protein [Xanthobacteraceae bacterium]|nr:PAS domain-containing protein [Xanthobacteraceae bacterium]
MLILFDGNFGHRDTLRFLEEKLGAGLFSWDIAQDRLLWSGGMFALFGFAPGAVEPTRALVESMTHPQDRRPPNSLERAIQQGLPLDRQFRIIWKNGRVRWLSSSTEVLMDHDGKPERLIGLVVDITSSREESMRLELLEHRLQSITQAAKCASGGSGGVLGPGEQLADVAGRLLSDPEDALRLQDILQKANANRAAFSLEHRTPEGALARSSIAPVFNREGSVVEWLGLSLNLASEQNAGCSAPPTLTGALIRGGRGILNWSVKDLSEASEVSAAVLRRIEEFDGVSSNSDVALAKIRAVMQKAGVEFCLSENGQGAVCLRNGSAVHRS